MQTESWKFYEKRNAGNKALFIHIMEQRIPLVCLLIDWPYRQKSLNFKGKGEKDMLQLLNSYVLCQY